ncbi:D-aminoacylase [Siminovitchia terrae]|uniref:N-acyl-D-amino-acid deacylase family protein n=1 Tax=Siminovitchia terrae TaxID=1914933 RepID=UPI001AFEFB31|nr:D-aminoacylase [Siminovitchia terrae]GIN90992.1 D-aminoacylase [Siminovitchia terrae]
MYDVIIRNGMVCDGTGNPWTKLDIGITDGKIIRLDKMIHEQAQREIDASGSIVSPGFIDPHVHSDLLCTKPEIHNIRVLQGITTELFGQDGISVAPVSENTKLEWQKQLKGLNGDIGEWPWQTVDDYLSFLEGSDIIGNAAYLIPHGNIRTLVVGFEGRQATKEECKEMRELVEEGMRQGAFGISSGIQYPPCAYATLEELIEICKGAAKYDGCFVVHIRNESNLSLEALDEVIEAARQSGIRLHISHFKVCGKINRDKLEKALHKLEDARQEGIEVTFDQYPYTAASTMLQAILPPWAQADGTGAILSRLRDPQLRQRIKEEMLHNGKYDNPVRNNGWDHIVIASVTLESNRKFEGKSIQEIGEMQQQDPADAALDLLISEEAAATMIIHWGVEEDVTKVMENPLQMVGSDGVFGGKPHPRLYGSFARVLGKYAREEQIFSIPEAVRKMTSAPAQLLRLRKRGMIREGYWGDLVVFDPAVVVDCATFEEPHQLPSGILHVLINGKLTVFNGKYVGETAGQVIRRGNEA